MSAKKRYVSRKLVAEKNKGGFIMTLLTCELHDHIRYG